MVRGCLWVWGGQVFVSGVHKLNHGRAEHLLATSVVVCVRDSRDRWKETVPELGNLASSNKHQGKAPKPGALQVIPGQVEQEGDGKDKPAD